MDGDPGYGNGPEDDPENLDGIPGYLVGIPKEVFGRVVTSPAFRRDLFAEGADLSDVLRRAHIDISPHGLEQLEKLIELERKENSLHLLDGDPPIDIA